MNEPVDFSQNRYLSLIQSKVRFFERADQYRLLESIGAKTGLSATNIEEDDDILKIFDNPDGKEETRIALFDRKVFAVGSGPGVQFKEFNAFREATLRALASGAKDLEVRHLFALDSQYAIDVPLDKLNKGFWLDNVVATGPLAGVASLEQLDINGFHLLLEDRPKKQRVSIAFSKNVVHDGRDYVQFRFGFPLGLLPDKGKFLDCVLRYYADCDKAFQRVHARFLESLIVTQSAKVRRKKPLRKK